MTLSLLPMSVLGARPGTVINPRNAPVGPSTFNFTIDAVPMSGLTDVAGNVVLDFALSGGGANAEHVGFASGVAVTFAAGSGFRVNGEESGPEVDDFLALINAAPLSGLGHHSDTNHYRQLILTLVTPGNAPPAAFATGLPVLEGFLSVQVTNLSANRPDANLTIDLRTGGQGIQPTNIRLLGANLVGDWNNGVSIVSAGSVPMIGMARLAGIRITENLPGRLVGMTGTRDFYVRLVAERGFRWDTGDMLGYIGAGALVGRLNSAVFGSNVYATVVTAPAPTTYPAGAIGRPSNGMWLNTNTDRHELYLRVSMPARAGGFIAETTNAELTIDGLTLVPIPGARTQGNVTVDVYVGGGSGADGNQPAWGAGRINDIIFSAPSAVPAPGVIPLQPFGGGTRGFVAGAFWTQHDNRDGYHHWNAHNLVVANLDHDGAIAVNAATPVNLVSGRIGDTWLHDGGSGSIQLVENVPGTLFRALDRFEFRPVQAGVRIVDAAARGRVGGGNIPAGQGWTAADWQNVSHTGNFVSALTDFSNGSVTFAPRSLDTQGESRVRSMEVRLRLSVEAGFEANYGGNVDIQVIRNGVYVGTARIATVTDPIEVISHGVASIYRPAFDVLPLTEVASFTVRETAAGNLRAGDELWFHLEATQDGRPVVIPMGQMALFLGEVEINEDESRFWVTPIANTFGAGHALGGSEGFRVVRQSQDVPGELTFRNVYVAGPTVTNLDWHVVVTGPQVAANSHLHMPAREARTLIEDRGVFYGRAYSTVVLEVTGTPTVGVETPEPPGQQVPSIIWTHGMQANGAPILIVRGGATLVQARMFTDTFGGNIGHSAGVVTATGTNIETGLPVTVVMHLGQPVATINGVAGDIATIVGQPAIAGQIAPYVYNGRTYVPGRFLAHAFGISFRSVTGGIEFNFQ